MGKNSTENWLGKNATSKNGTSEWIGKNGMSGTCRWKSGNEFIKVLDRIHSGKFQEVYQIRK